LDLNKLLLAAAGIFAMAFGWWLLSVIFSAGYGEPPTWPGSYEAKFPPAEGKPDRAWTEFKKDREHWNLMHEAAGFGGVRRYDVADLAESKDALQTVTAALANKPASEALADLVKENKITPARAQVYRKFLGHEKRSGTLSTWPWFEDRGPNPFLLVTGQAGIP